MKEIDLTHEAGKQAPYGPSAVYGRLNVDWPWPSLLVCSAVLLLSFRHTLFLMVDTWTHSRTYSHCFLILPLFLYLVWLRRERLIDLKPATNYWGLPILAAIAFIWILGNLGEVRVVQELAVVSMLIVIVWTLLGTIVVRVFAFPLLFLFFSVPFGTSLTRPLQDFTAWFVIHALTISHIPAVLENHTILLPNGVWAVAEACSGIRFLLTSLVLGTVFSFLMYRSPVRRLIFMCASIILPVIGNGLRAYGIIALAYVTNNRLAAGVDHIVYGAVFVVLIQLILMLIGLRWRQHPEPISRIIRTDAEMPRRRVSGWWPDRTLFAGAVSLLIVIAAPLFAAKLWSKSPDITAWDDPPVRVTAPWLVTANSDLNWEPDQRNPERKFDQSYQYLASRVALSWALYSGRRQMDFEMTPDGTENTQWILTDDGIKTAMVNGRRIQVSGSLIESAHTSRRIWTWYYVSGEHTASRERVRLLQAKARLLGRPASVIVIRLGTDNLTNSADSEQELQDFLLHTSFLPVAGPKRDGLKQVSAVTHGYSTNQDRTQKPDRGRLRNSLNRVALSQKSTLNSIAAPPAAIA